MPRKYTEDDVLVTLDTFSKIAGKTKESVDYLEYEINEGISAPLVIAVRVAESFIGSTVTAKSRLDGTEYTKTLESTYTYIKVKNPGEYVVSNSHDDSVEIAVVGEPLQKEVYFTDYYGTINVTVDELLIGETIEATNGENRVEILAESSISRLEVFKKGEWSVGIKGTELIEKKQVQLSEVGEVQQCKLEVTESVPTITVTLAEELKDESVVCKKEQYIRKKTPKEGVVKFFIPEQGQWIVHLEASELIREQVSINENKNYDVTLDLEDLGTPVLIVTSKEEDIGKLIKVSRGDTTLEKPLLASGTVYILPSQGEWIISCDDYPEENKSVLCNENKVYRVCYRAVIFGIRVKQSEPDPKMRIEVIEDTELYGLNPITVNTQNGTVNYGDMEDTFLFQAMNHPVLLSIDGQEEIELDPNDYSQRKEGGVAPNADKSSNYNMFSKVKKFYTYQTTSQGYEYYYISDYKIDDNYKAIGFIREDDSECDYTYLATYLGSYDDSQRLRSNNGVRIRNWTQYDEYALAARKNGDNYTIEQHQQINIFEIAYLMMVQDFNSQTAIGNGRDIYSGAEAQTTHIANQTTGFANTKGPIAYNTSDKAIKFMHVEDLWFGDGFSWEEGILFQNDVTYVRMKPPYITSFGEEASTSTYTKIDGVSTYNGYVKWSIADNKYGRLPAEGNGSNSTYECDGFYSGGMKDLTPCLRGADGLFYRDAYRYYSTIPKNVSRLSYLPPKK